MSPVAGASPLRGEPVNTTVKYILAVVAGVIAGSAVNMGIIQLGGHLIPPPPGADLTTTEGMRASMHLLEAKHLLMPFLAHALGTLTGAALAAAIAPAYKLRFAIGLGVFFLMGGIAAAIMFPAPLWFIVLDLVAAYIPMALLGYKLTSARS
jgi:hypothetical protein